MRFLAITVFALLLLAHNLPYLIKDQALIWFKGQGVEAPKIKSIDIHWLRGGFTLSGVEAVADQGVPLALETLAVDLNLKSLLDQRIHFETLRIVGLHSGVIDLDGKMFIGPIDLSQFESQEKPEPEQPSSKWQLGIDTVDITSLSWTVEMTPEKQHLQIDQGQVVGFYQWEKARQTQVSLKGAFNESPFVMDTTTAPLSDQRETQLAFRLHDFALHSALASVVPQLQANVDVDLTIGFSFVDNNLKLTHQGKLSLANVSWKDERNTLNLSSFDWQGGGAVQMQANQLVGLNAKGHMGLEELALQQGKATSVKLAALKWQGPLNYKRPQSQIQQIEASHQLLVSNLTLNAAPIALTLAQLKGDAGMLQLDLKAGALQKIVVKPRLVLNKLALSYPDGEFSAAKIVTDVTDSLTVKTDKEKVDSLSGALSLALVQLQLKQADQIQLAAAKVDIKTPIILKGLSSTPLITSQPQLDLAGVEAILPQMQLAVQQLSTQANIEEMAVNAPALKVPRVELSGFDLKDRHANTVALLGKLTLQDAHYNSQKLGFSALNLQHFRLLADQSKAPLLAVQQLGVKHLAMSGQKRLDISEVAVNALRGDIRLDEKGNVLGLQTLETLAPKDTAGANQPAKAGSRAPMQIVLGKFNMSGENSIAFEDKSVSPWFKSKVAIKTAEISKINTAAQGVSPFTLDAVINERSPLNVKGSYSLFGTKKNGEWQLELGNLSMPLISPYAGKFSGYFLDSGQLSVQSKGSIKNDVLAGKNDINIQELAVSSADSKATEQTNQSLNMPLSMAISILEDDEGKINLEVPVSGSLDDPNFGYASVVEIIAKKGLKQAAFGILSKALQPYGALVTLATSAIDAQQSGSFINLAPVNFEPAQSILAPKMQDYLQKIAAMMQQRKKLKLNICATAVAQDNAVLAPQVIASNSKQAKPLKGEALAQSVNNALQALAAERGEKVRAHLEQLKVKGDRLFLCLAKVDLKRKVKQPGVSLGL